MGEGSRITCAERAKNEWERSVVVNEAPHARLGNGAARKNKAYVTTRVVVKK